MENGKDKKIIRIITQDVEEFIDISDFLKEVLEFETGSEIETKVDKSYQLDNKLEQRHTCS